MFIGEKEIADYKIVFKNGAEYLIDTLSQEEFNVKQKKLEIKIFTPVINPSLIEDIYNSKIKTIIRLQPVRIVETGKDKILQTELFNPELLLKMKRNAEGTNFIYYELTFSVSKTEIKNFIEEKEEE